MEPLRSKWIGDSFGPDGPGLTSASNAIHALLNHSKDILVPAFAQLEDPDERLVPAARTALVEAAL